MIAGGPCAQNPEPMALFIDVFRHRRWRTESAAHLRPVAAAENSSRGRAKVCCDGEAGRSNASNRWRRWPRDSRFATCRGSTSPSTATGRSAALNRTRPDVPETIEPSVVADLDAIPLPTRPIVPFVECVHDRIAIEIMRGCPWQCRFCQSTVIKRPLRIRSVDTIVNGALESYQQHGIQ